MYNIAQLAEIINAKPLQTYGNANIEHILLDSRKLLFPDSSVFFALDGPRRNGNLFITDLYHRGIRCFVVNELFDKESLAQFESAAFLQVDNVLEALQLLVIHHRKLFNIPVIGITGSNGKTIVKEWLYQLLQPDYQIVRNPKSYNSQIGVPLSVWQINQQHTLGIFEAGISLPGEMQHLEKIIEPTIGVFTNIGDAHSEGFVNTRQKIDEKLTLFLHANTLIYCADTAELNDAVIDFKNNLSNPKILQLFSWSKKNPATLQISSLQYNPTSTIIKAVFQSNNIVCEIPFTDEASVENALSCLCTLLVLNIKPEAIAERMLWLRAVEMRLELKQGINNCSVINDSYSADITSFTIALDFLAQQQQHPNKTVILSDILQSGKSHTQLYHDIAFILQQKNIKKFIGIGPEISAQKDAFIQLDQSYFFASTTDFIQHFHSFHFFNETILLKGARVFEFERISHLLEQKVHQTVLEINLNALSHNLKQYQLQLKPNVKLMAMVKAFSYGTGSFEIANLLQFHKVDYLAVAYADEGVELRKAGITLPIMVMNAEEATFDVLVQYNLEPELYSFNLLDAFQGYLLKSAITNYPVHIKVDTGMHRLGFEFSDIDMLGDILSASDTFKIQSVFSHLASSEDVGDDSFTKNQSTVFLQSCEKLQYKLRYPFLKHIANTSAIHRHKEMQMDMVRLGIGLYGVDGDAAMQQQLKNVATLKTTISQIKNVKSGESVGYNRKGIATKDSVIATVRIGYADGYPRNLSNGAGKMYVNGSLVPVIGNVCMDMTMLDITGITVDEGDDVIVFGEVLPVYQVAKQAQTIAYEILTGISQRVKRVYFEE